MTVLTASTQRKLFFDAIWRVCRWGTRASPGLSAELRGGQQKALGLGSRVEVLAFADQAVVSATSFLTMVMVGRYSNPAELGAYAIGITVLAAMYTIQASLISHPYSIQRFRVLGTPAQHAGSALVHSVLLSTVVTIVLAVTAVGLYAFGTTSQLFALTLVLAGVAPFALLREFDRGFAFTHLHIAQSLILDVAVAAIQISMLAWLGWTGRMSAVTAFGALGASCGAVALGWLCLARAEFVIELRQVRATLKLSWGLGKWLTLGQVAGQLRRFSIYWLSVIIAGAAVTGVYAACMSIVSFANPVMFGLNNILTPKAVLAWKEGGAAGLRRQIIRDTLLLGLVMALSCVVVSFAGEAVMRFLYHGKVYEGQSHIIATLAFATFVAAIGLPAVSALAAMERPRAIVGVGAVASILTVVLVWWLMREWGLAGAAYGSLAGNVVSSVGLWLAFVQRRSFVKYFSSRQLRTLLIENFVRHAPAHVQRASEALFDLPIPKHVRDCDLLFIHVPKNAGTTIAVQLYGSQVAHRPASYFYDSDRDWFLSRKRFAVVRNPWDRAVSAYEFIRRAEKGLVVADPKVLRIVRRCETFEKFVTESLVNDTIVQRDPAFLPQHHFLYDNLGKCLVENIFRYEDLSSLEAWLGVCGVPFAMSHSLNRSEGRGDYRSYYAKSNLIEIVGRFYADDIARFNYQF